MKQKNENIPDLLQKALNSLEGMQQASPGDFFYTRVQARLLHREVSTWETIGNLLSRPAVVISGLCLILLVNMVAIFDQSAKLTTAANDSNEISLVEEYTIASNSLYDYENGELK